MTIIIANKHHGDIPRGAISFYIGRGSPLGNRHVIDVTRGMTRNKVCDLYEEEFNTLITTSQQAYDMVNKIYDASQREDVYLVCFCAPQRCHGETVKRYICNMV